MRTWVILLGLAILPASALGQGTPAPAQGDLEQRLRRMEALNERLARQVEGMAEQNKAVSERLKKVSDENKALNQRLDALTRTGSAKPGTAPDDSPDGPPAADDAPRRSPATDDDQPPDVRTDEPEPRPREAPTSSVFAEGFKWETKDGEFTLQFHNETQLDTRIYARANSDPVNQIGFYVPRMRFIFNGRLTKPIEYSVSINKGLGSLDLLDAYLNFNYDDRFQLRIGRFRSPFAYDWYALSNQFLTSPERSIWAVNYGYNRNFAVMGHGEILKDSAEYAIAAANGPRNSYFDQNGHKDLLAYFNIRPFMNVERLKVFKHLNLGGSLAYGIQDQEPLPVAFRTSANATESPGTVEAAPAFLKLNDDVLERGTRQLWELHAAYYYKGLSLWGAWDGGFNTYGLSNSGTDVHVPTHGFHVAGGYFLTGEHVERRGFVEPLHPFDLRKGRRGLGAFEIQARYSEFFVGRQIFTGGLADPTLWTNRVYAIDSGLNWYLNKYVKVYFDWQHSVFGNPVQYRPGGLQRTSDLFWIRCQVYF